MIIFYSIISILYRSLCYLENNKISNQQSTDSNKPLSKVKKT